MKTLAPVIITLIAIIALVTCVSAQSRIHNPDLPKGLVFQWRIATESVHASWSNEDFTVSRDTEGLIIYYGAFRTLAQAMDNLPILPAGVGVSDVKLIPFFNQVSISAADAFVLLGDRTWYDANMQTVEDAVSFTVYFETYAQPISPNDVAHIGEELSFEIMPNRTFAYSAGTFDQLEEAEAFREKLRKMGYELAEVSKYLNGQKVAHHEVEELFAYVSGY